MPLKSKKQRRYLWATNPALARHFEEATPKDTELPEQIQKEAYSRGFEEHLGGSSTLGSIRSLATLGPMPQLIPSSSGAVATKMMLEILRDPKLSRQEKNIILARLNDRGHSVAAPGDSRLLIGSKLLPRERAAANAYLAAQTNPATRGFLSGLLFSGLGGYSRLLGPTSVVDRRRSPDEERHSAWKISRI